MATAISSQKVENRHFVVPSDLEPVNSEFLSANDAAGKRMWLFQVPKEVNIQDLNGVNISWKRQEKVQLGGKLYEVSKKEGILGTSHLCAVVSEQEGEPVLLPGAIQGLVTLSRTMDVPETGVPCPREIGLEEDTGKARQRFLPFGSDDMITVSKVRKKEKKSKKKHAEEGPHHLPIKKKRKSEVKETKRKKVEKRDVELDTPQKKKKTRKKEN